MAAKFDIFRGLPDGEPVWIKAVETLDEAKRLVKQFAAHAPGDYFIFDATNGQVIAR